MNQRLFGNAFNSEELIYKQCSVHLSALTLVHFLGGCFKLLSECSWTGLEAQRAGGAGKARLAGSLLPLGSSLLDLVRFHQDGLRARPNVDFSHSIASSLLTENHSTVGHLD